MFPGREIYRGNDPHARGFRQFHRALSSYKVILFIGFSFRDDDVLQILLSVNAQRKIPIKIVTVNPVLGQNELMTILEDATSRIALPVRIPALDDILSLNIWFGRGDFDRQIMDAITAII